MLQESKYGHVLTYGRGLEHLLAHTYGQGSCTWLGQNGETASSSCSWGANRLGRNGIRRVHREPTGLDGIADRNEAWRTAERRKRPCVRPATFETGSCSSGRIWCTAKRRKRTSYGRNRGSCSLGGVWRTAKWDSTGYCSSPPLTSSSLHRLLFIHRRPPPASSCDCSSTGSCSSSLHRALLHRLLFNHPSTV